VSSRTVGTVVDVVDVVKEYGAAGGPVRAVDGISLEVANGEFLAIVGPSGSGKSTLLNLIGALDVPTSGTVRIAGYDIATLPDRKLSWLRNAHIGFVFQQFNLIEGLTAVENVAVGLVEVEVPWPRAEPASRRSPKEKRRVFRRASCRFIGILHRRAPPIAGTRRLLQTGRRMPTTSAGRRATPTKF